MGLNVVILEGRIPYDLEIKNGGNEESAFLGFSISVRRDYKPEGEQYYPEDLLYCKAFRKTAIFIDEYFAKGDSIIVEGQVRRDDDYENKEGETVKGLMYIQIQKVHFTSGRKSGEKSSTKNIERKSNSSQSSKKSKTSIKQSRQNPFEVTRAS